MHKNNFRCIILFFYKVAPINNAIPICIAYWRNLGDQFGTIDDLRPYRTSAPLPPYIARHALPPATMPGHAAPSQCKRHPVALPPLDMPRHALPPFDIAAPRTIRGHKAASRHASNASGHAPALIGAAQGSVASSHANTGSNASRTMQAGRSHNGSAPHS